MQFHIDDVHRRYTSIYQQTIRLDKKHTKAHAALGMLLYRAKQFNEAKKEISELVGKYYNQFKKNNKIFTPGDRINYAGRVFDEKEMQHLADSMLDFWLTSGRFTDEFEQKLGDSEG